MVHVRQTREQQREEMARLRESVSCIVVLEQNGYRRDKTESSRRHQKFRRGEGEIIIVTHEGRGWWCPCTSDGRGTVVDLVQFLNPGWAFPDVVQELRRISGIAPLETVYTRSARSDRVRRGPAWEQRKPLKPGSPAWQYLNRVRRIPDRVLARAVELDLLREGLNGTACFSHSDNGGRHTGAEMRGPDYRGFSTGGDKRLFRFQYGRPEWPVLRLVICEGAIDALSYAAMDPSMLRTGALYVGTAGGMSPEAFAELEQLIATIPRDGVVVVATDADAQGDRYAETYLPIGRPTGKHCVRHRPDEALGDWNSVLQSFPAPPVWKEDSWFGKRIFTSQSLELAA